MAIPQTTIDLWFARRKKPTDPQFRQTWRSFWHKDEAIPISQIEGLAEFLNSLQGLFAPKQFVWSGSGSYELPVGKVFEFAVVKSATDLYTLKIGLTAGGDELVTETDIPANKSVVVGRVFKADAATTLYFSELPANTNVIIYTR
jgi:hypothetical protein